MVSGKIIVYQLLITVCLLLMLEAGARVVTSVYFETDAQDSWFITSSDLGWDRRPNFDGLDICNAYRSFSSRGFVSVDEAQLQEHTLKHHRVLFVGDSNTYGFCLTTKSTFVEVADRQLRDYDLINLGVPAYTSYQGYKELLKYGDLIRPEKVFISFNYNDRLYVAGDKIDSKARFNTSLLTRFLEYSHLYRIVRALGRRSGIIKPSIEKATMHVDRLKPRVDPQNYRTNLIKMVEWSRQHGATPYFILLGDNPNRTKLLRKGVHLTSGHNHNDDDAAIRVFKSILSNTRSVTSVIARKYLSLIYSRESQKDLAKKALLMPPVYLRWGTMPIFQDSDYNNIMRDVAREYMVQLVDAKSELDRHPWVFFDFCHFDAEGHELVGKLISQVLENDEGQDDRKTTTSTTN